MTDASPKGRDARDRPRQDLDERVLARALSRGLPVVTVVAALIGGAFGGVSLAILLLAGGTLLGVIALFWASLRVLSGEVDLPSRFAAAAAAEPATRGDALSARKKMLVRALKDLDNEHALGRLEDDDYAQLAQSYRDELKVVLRTMDDALAPYREKAEDAARRHLARVAKTPKNAEDPANDGPDEATSEPPAKAPSAKAPSPEIDTNDDAPHGHADDARSGDANDGSNEDANHDAPQISRITCASCQASNEPDARFCKGCGANLDPRAAVPSSDEGATSP